MIWAQVSYKPSCNYFWSLHWNVSSQWFQNYNYLISERSCLEFDTRRRAKQDGTGLKEGRSCSVWSRAKILKLTPTINISILLYHPALSSSKKEHGQIRHKSTSVLWFGANSTSVVMNIDIKLNQSLTWKKQRRIFSCKTITTLQNYPLLIFAILGFIIYYSEYVKLNKDCLTKPSYFAK